MSNSLIDYINQHKQDAVLWQAAEWLREAGDNPFEHTRALGQIAELLNCVPGEVLRTQYAIAIAKAGKFKPKLLVSLLKDTSFATTEPESTASEERPLPDWANDADVARYGFTELVDKDRTGYWFATGDNHLVQRTNFVITPLYHIYGNDNRRMIAVTNGHVTMVIEVPSRAMLAVEQFTGFLFSEGHFLPKAGFTKDHLFKVLNKIGNRFPVAHELNNLGWQTSEGFFAFADMTYRPPQNDGAEGILVPYNEYGIAEIDEVFYLSPSVSHSNKRVRKSESIYENDLYLVYKPSPIDFSEWCSLMVRAYGQNAWFAIPFAVATLFRDFIFHITRIPHLYAYGSVGSGKSVFGESISNLFFSGLNTKGELYQPMNLSQGTEYAYWSRMERFFNCPNVLNEFDENKIPDTFFGGIKSAYDGEGRPKGAGQKNKSISQKINCTIVLLGQYLGTKDSNSVLTRSIPLAFRQETDRPQEQKDAFKRLKELEFKGINGILIELMNLRPFIETKFAERFAWFQQLLFDDLKSESIQAPVRIIKNIACMITMVELLGFRKQLPFTIDEFYNYAKNYTRQMTGLLASTSSVSDFWSSVEYLADRNQIKEGFDFDISVEQSITVMGEDRQTVKTSFNPPKEILFIRLANVHKLYMELCVKMRITSLNESTLMLYLKDQDYFLGYIKSRRFRHKGVTSCIAVEYSALGISLTRQEERQEQQPVFIIGEVTSELMPVPGLDRFKAWITEYSETKIETDASKTQATIYCCFFSDPLAVGQVTKGYKIQLKGMLEVISNGQRAYRNIDVTEFECVPNYRPFERDFEKK